MSDHDDVAAVLASVQSVGPETPQAVELADAVARHVAARAPQPRPPVDPAVLAALRPQEETTALSATLESTAPPPPLMVHVDFNELHERLGEPEVWTVLGKLKDLLG